MSKLKVVVARDVAEMGALSAADGGSAIVDAIEQRGHATIIVATGSSQLSTLAALTQDNRIDWTRVSGFHLDEYLGLPETHRASFRRYLKERLVDLVPMADFQFVDGEARDPQAECRRLGEAIAKDPVDVAFVGIGENGHLAFNDPPADFETEDAYLVVDLDEACRRQQLGEGWFDSLDAVPRQAISMSVRQILKSNQIVCTVPDQRKAAAVADAVEGEISRQVPASILQTHPRTTLYLDPLRPAACGRRQINIGPTSKS